MPEPFRLSKIGVIMLGVTDLEKSVPYYRDRLGLKLTMQFEGFAFFDAGGLALVLSLALPKATGRGAGATEVVFSVEHVRTAYEALGSQGIEFSQEPRQISGPNWGATFRSSKIRKLGTVHSNPSLKTPARTLRRLARPAAHPIRVIFTLCTTLPAAALLSPS